MNKSTPDAATSSSQATASTPAEAPQHIELREKGLTHKIGEIPSRLVTGGYIASILILLLLAAALLLLDYPYTGETLLQHIWHSL
jgi:hypothetical protein